MKRSFRMRWWKDVQKWEKCCWFPKLPIEVENRKRWASWREPPIKIRRRLNGFLCSYATRNAIMVRIHTTTLLKRWAATGRVQLDSEKLAAKVRGERITKKAKGIRSNQHCRIAEKTLRHKVRRSTDSYALMRREMLLCMLVCDAMLSCNETSCERLRTDLCAQTSYELEVKMSLSLSLSLYSYWVVLRRGSMNILGEIRQVKECILIVVKKC